MSQIKLPETAEDFYAELGREIIKLAAQRSSITPPAALNDPAKKELFIAAGVTWCRQRRGILITLYQSARILGPGITYQIINELPECRTFLESCKPPYFAEVLRAGLALRGEEYINFINLLGQVAAGI